MTAASQAEAAAASQVQGTLVWSPKDTSSTRIDAFRRKVAQRRGLQLDDYHALWRWSVTHPADFWADVWDETEVIASKRWEQVLPEGAAMYPPPRWFEGARLNFAENMLRHRGSTPAVYEATEPSGDGAGVAHLSSYTHDELRQAVANAARAMRRRGLKAGDRVALYAPNCAATLIAFLAASSIGAVWLSCAPDFGAAGVLERLRALQPRFLFTCDGVRYNGRKHPHAAKVKEVLDGLKAEGQALELLVEIEYIGGQAPIEGAMRWTDFLQEGAGDDHIDFEQLDFNHPLWVLFSSGTTGKPKAITHRAGGMLLQLSKEHLIHGGLSKDDVFFQFTTPAWMMHNFLIATLVAGCAVVLYDGAPLKPANVLWELADRYGITVFGTSAGYLSALQRSGYRPKDEFPNLKVRQILSTGSPLRADLYPWIIDALGPVLIGSITGGTDIASLFAGHNEALPVRAGEIQARNLGMDVDVFDEAGKPIAAGAGEGDLVCKTPFPAQPLGFWGQPESRHFDTYYSQFPGVWYHGDYVSLTPSLGLEMRGRSDAILNPGGIRFGSSEIYETLEAHKTSAHLCDIDAAVVCALKTRAGDDEVVVLLVTLRPDAPSATPEGFKALEAAVKSAVRSARSARHVPAFIRRVHGVPLTLNGKLSEIPVKKLLNGADLSTINRSTLQNPECLEEYVQLGKELRDAL